MSGRHPESDHHAPSHLTPGSIVTWSYRGTTQVGAVQNTDPVTGTVWCRRLDQLRTPVPCPVADLTLVATFADIGELAQDTDQ